jgi:hypothetical protein
MDRYLTWSDRTIEWSDILHLKQLSQFELMMVFEFVFVELEVATRFEM